MLLTAHTQYIYTHTHTHTHTHTQYTSLRYQAAVQGMSSETNLPDGRLN